MSIMIMLFVSFSVIAFIMRIVCFKSQVSKVKASWISFVLAVIATSICTLINNGEQQSTLLTGFATMLVCYNIFVK